MTPEERDRLIAVEVAQRGQQQWLASIDGKVDELIAISNMGKGAWLFILKAGGVAAAIIAAAAWVYDRFHK